MTRASPSLPLPPLPLALLGCTLAACGDGDPVRPGPEEGPTVTAVEPRANQIGADPDRAVVLTFDRALDPASVSEGAVAVFGRWSGPVAGALELRPDGRSLRFRPAAPFSAGERVTVQLLPGSVKDGAGRGLAHGFTWSFRVGTEVTGGTFDAGPATVRVRRPGEGRVQTYGAYAGDLDRDGWSDLLVPNEASNDLRIFLNDGSGGYGPFTVVPFPAGGEPSTNEGADLDGDGDIDWVVGAAHGRFMATYLGDGGGRLVHGQDLEVGQDVRGICVLDIDDDGDPDLAATSHGASRLVLFENDGSGRFSRTATLDAGAGEWSCEATDMDGDGLADLVVGSREDGRVTVLRARGDGSFDRGDAADAGGDPWMLATGDMNGDGRADAVAANALASSLVVLRGDGSGGLTLLGVHAIEGGFPLAVDLGDVDGDGDLDVVVSDFATARFLLFENDGEGGLVQARALPSSSAASCAVLHDRDRDGDLDLTGIDEVDDLLLLWENR